MKQNYSLSEPNSLQIKSDELILHSSNKQYIDEFVADFQKHLIE